jgi:hypothetical protein
MFSNAPAVLSKLYQASTVIFIMITNFECKFKKNHDEYEQRILCLMWLQDTWESCGDSWRRRQ